MGIEQRTQASGNLGNRRLPVDGIEAAIRAPAKWRRQPVGVMDIVHDALCLVAQVSVRARMIGITSHLRDTRRRSIASHCDVEATIHVTEVACTFVPPKLGQIYVLRVAANAQDSPRAGGNVSTESG